MRENVTTTAIEVGVVDFITRRGGLYETCFDTGEGLGLEC